MLFFFVFYTSIAELPGCTTVFTVYQPQSVVVLCSDDQYLKLLNFHSANIVFCRQYCS